MRSSISTKDFKLVADILRKEFATETVRFTRELSKTDVMLSSTNIIS
jgi:hypothetical protein